MTVFKIGVVTGSIRQGRLCPKIVQYIVKLIESNTWQKDFALYTIDLKEWDLPLSTESTIPAMIKRSDDYEHECTRNWSKEIYNYDAFIFVTPQYNWGYPAALKNALDYLYNEWANKPAMIVSYGSHGGSKCNSQLEQVLTGLGMVVSRSNPEIPFPTRKQILEGVPENFNFDDIAGIRNHILLSTEELISNL
ncbi:related to NAD(P)H-dependent FMN reductase LOT6 [Zygosaccharomyces bailii ISA1307]|uniref:ZYBA0S11-00122g1_1 n=1 Tax=Zygosaccharomyces bailii (strain CLIB 213 / ATCC 58445 / CBS 680 / BCRC 21525 / NBRC 1098 / NCYC 1416 / NRRL Y-2227) TaxID=1333698 RepID=A0A8J2XDI9_ZYGB2|nr:ZYBA0S11-00122g1_1 [Zygosaccharomyces bailii CLIB 213]CDH17255.1 related to NAD(P)H-dependent FMN reductase LOT6 [Zygosaccharomyces bailii ISA1307]